MITKIKISKVAKEKILKMAIALFPEYHKITISDDGTVKFFRKGLFKLWPRVKIHYLDLCLEGFPRRMSKNRYGNNDLTIIYYKKLGSLLKHDGINFMVDYLWDEFLKVRVVDVLFDLNSMIIPLPTGGLVRKFLSPSRVLTQGNYEEDTEEIELVTTEGTIIRRIPKNRNKPTLEDILRVPKVAAAALLLFGLLNISQVVATFRVVNIFPNIAVYSPL